MPVGVHASHPPIVGAGVEGVLGGEAGVVGSVGVVHGVECGIGGDIHLVVGRVIGGLPRQRGCGDGDAVGGADQHRGGDAFDEGPGRAVRALVPVGVHASHPPIVGAGVEGVLGGEAGVVGSVGVVHGVECGIGGDIHLVVGRVIGGLPRQRGCGDGDAVGGAEQHRGGDVLDEVPGCAGGSLVPVGVHPQYPPVPGTVGDGVAGGEAGVVGGVGVVHRVKRGICTHLHLVVGRAPDGIPFQGRLGHGDVVRGGAQGRSGDVLGEVDPAAPRAVVTATVVGAHPPVERLVGEIVGVVGGQVEIVGGVAPVLKVRVTLGADLNLIVHRPTGGQPREGGGNDGVALSRRNGCWGRWLAEDQNRPDQTQANAGDDDRG